MLRQNTKAVTMVGVNLFYGLRYYNCIILWDIVCALTWMG